MLLPKPNKIPPPTPVPLPRNVPQCRHTKLDGLRCGSPAMKGKRQCYFHRRLQLQQHRNTAQHARRRVLLPPLEDAASIQFALMEITQAVLDDRITEKKAGLVLYALQTAALNLRQLNPEPQEQLIRQDYPEAVPEMEKMKRAASGDTSDEDTSIMRSLCEAWGLPTESILTGVAPDPSELPPGYGWDVDGKRLIPDRIAVQGLSFGGNYLRRPDADLIAHDTE